MTQTPLKNIAASERQRLLNKSKSDIWLFQELVQYYAIERFLYRISLSRHSNRFILKSALMLRIWKAPQTKPTMDIDMFGRTSNKVSVVISNVIDFLSVDVDPDGLSFFPNKITTEHITKEFIDPIASAYSLRKPPPSRWSAPGPWV